MCYFISLVIFGAECDSTHDQGFDRQTFGAAFFLAIFVLLLSVVAGICAILGVRGQQVMAISSTSGEAERKQHQQQKQQQQEQQQQQTTSNETKA
ncbi:hypothetical protein PoB_003517100 [Plakobranchus ocellatus]|uniref:Uncharacterized protein n=1 Tax=Plakobranchus ocellatus TaxID=259542 RepID=A0AAV4ABZ4_9GAST|nr:hypothetical protein PoB_003517100 [Plakobranchus ocellatus]